MEPLISSSSSSSPSAKFWWTISKFSLLTERKYLSDTFTAGRCKWRVTVYPKGRRQDSDHFAMYLKVAGVAALPTGWTIDAEYTLALVNQLNNQTNSTSTIKESRRHEFSARGSSDHCGYTSYKLLVDLYATTKGYLVNDTLIVEADVFVHNFNIIAPPPQPQVHESSSNTNTTTKTDMFDSFFNGLEEFVNDSNNKKTTCSSTEEGSSSIQVLLAKESLKACLSDLFKLNMTEKLTSALSTLSRAKAGLSNEQRRSIDAFMANFDEFLSDYLMFEQENSVFELQKLGKDQLCSVMKNNHEMHIQNKKLLDSLTNEEEEIKKRIEQVKSRQAKLLVDWQGLVAESGELKAKCADAEINVAEAEEKKRIAEERMSRSSAAWSSFKAHFI